MHLICVVAGIGIYIYIPTCTSSVAWVDTAHEDLINNNKLRALKIFEFALLLITIGS